MHHHIYHTKGFILSSKNTGEANRILTIYTKELGLIKAVVQGIRLNKSKLRFSLQDLSYAKIDFVRGKDFWRITSAINVNSFPFARRQKDSLFLMIKISKLLERLCHGEETNDKIFDVLIQSFNFLDQTDVFDKSREALELHLVLSILNYLGYIGESEILADFLKPSFDDDMADDLIKARRSIILHINKALIESQL